MLSVAIFTLFHVALNKRIHQVNRNTIKFCSLKTHTSLIIRSLFENASAQPLVLTTSISTITSP